MSGLLEKVRATPEWQEFIARGAFKNSFMTGDEFEQLARRRARAAQGPDGEGGLPRPVSRIGTGAAG